MRLSQHARENALALFTSAAHTPSPQPDVNRTQQGFARFLPQTTHHRAIAVMALLYVIWALIFIYKSSNEIEGQRYFSLVDDAMISMRYAWRLAHGEGLTWNDGLRIEGYTNFLLVIIMAAAIRLLGTYQAIIAMQGLGIAYVLGSAALAYKIARRVLSKKNLIGPVCVFAMTLLYYPISYWSLMGMEAGLLCLLNLALLYIAIQPKVSPRSGLIIALLVGISFWIRPDALLVTGFIWLYYLSRLEEHRWRRMVQEGLIIAAFIASLSGFRIWYFGSIVPNTYILKVEGIPIPFRVAAGWSFVRQFLATVLLPLILTAAQLMRRFAFLPAFMLGLILAVTIYQIWTGGDVWVYWRMFVPVMPILFVLFMWSLQHMKWSWIMSLITISMLLMNITFIEEIFFIQLPFETLLQRRHIETALALNEITTGDIKIAVLAAGTVPYYSSQATVIDCLGKSDAYIARLVPDLSIYHPGHNKYDLEYCVGQEQPDYAEVMDYYGRDDIRAAHPEYQRFQYKGLTLWLNTRSKNIRWDLLEPVTP